MIALHTIDDVFTQLNRVIDEERRVGSRLALFPALYAELTQRLARGLREGEFTHPDRIDRIAVRFAQRYFDALETFRSGAEPTRSWQIAFDQARSGRMLIIQDLMLGINAHINLDLSIATAEVGGRDLAMLEADFMHINALLRELFDRTQDVISAHSPLFDVLDRLGSTHDEMLGTFAITKARDAAWQNAKVLAGLSGTSRDAWISMLDLTTSRLGHMIARPGLVFGKAIELVAATEERDVRVIVAALASVAL